VFQLKWLERTDDSLLLGLFVRASCSRLKNDVSTKRRGFVVRARARARSFGSDLFDSSSSQDSRRKKLKRPKNLGTFSNFDGEKRPKVTHQQCDNQNIYMHNHELCLLP
jgi:hypothetical protein